MGSLEDLDKAIECAREMLTFCPPGHPDHPKSLLDLFTCLKSRFAQTGKAEDMEEAMECDGACLVLLPAGHPQACAASHSLAGGLVARFKQAGLGDICSLTVHGPHVLPRVPSSSLEGAGSQQGHPSYRSDPDLHELMTFVENHVSAVDITTEHGSETKTLEEEIERLRNLGLAIKPSGPEQRTLLSYLGKVPTDSFLQAEDAVHEQEFMDYTYETYEQNPAEAIHDQATAVDLSSFGDRWDDSVRECNRALALFHRGDPNRGRALNSLANALHTRYEQTGQRGDLDEAITHYSAALVLCPQGHPARAMSLSSLAIALHTRFEQTGQRGDLDEAITHHSTALALCPQGHPVQAVSFYNLASALCIRFKQTGQLGDLDEAINHNSAALALRPQGHPDRAASLNSLANVLRTKFGHTGQRGDLDKAINHFSAALELYPHGNPARAAPLHNLALALRTRFEQTGQRGDLDGAINNHSAALALQPQGHPHRAMSLNGLGAALRTRFDQTGQDIDLGKAINHLYEALALFPQGHPIRGASHNNLAHALRTRGRIGDLDEAIKNYSAALALRPQGHPDRPISLTGLAAALKTRFDQTGQHDDLDDAINHHSAALALLPQSHPSRSSCLNNFADVLWTRFRRTDRPDSTQSVPCQKEKLNQICGYFLEAETLLSTIHPTHTIIKRSIANINLQLYELDTTQEMFLHTACEIFAASVEHPTSTIKDRLISAFHWSAAARLHKHKSVLQAYSACLSLVIRRSVQSPNLDLQHMSFFSIDDSHKSLASDAASAALDAGETEMAVEMLEQGRAILWSKMQGYRSPLLELRRIRPELAQRFGDLSTQIERQAMTSQMISSESNSEPFLPFDVQERKYRMLSEQWDTVVEEIRSVDGFQDFLRAVPFKTLQQAAAEGPIIVLNVSKYRCDAIIIYHAQNPVLVPLPGASKDGLAELVQHFLKPRASSLENFSKDMTPILRELWRDVVQPVVDELQKSGVPEKSRIWWCPTSELCGLPIHAAGPYSSKTKAPVARSDTIHKRGPPGLLVISEPDGEPGSVKLENVDEEVRQIQSVGSFVDILAGEKANCDAVVAELQKHSWAHFTCHGIQFTLPFHSLFLLHNSQRLEILDLIKARLPDAEFAFVSACHGAIEDLKSAPDEVIHLSAALQFAGFRGVVGTLWAMADIDGPDLARDFYQHMFRDLENVDFKDAATALNLATKAMRRKKVPFGRWVNFVHIGA